MKFVQDTPQNSTFAKILAGCIIAVIMVLFGVLSSCKSNEKRQAKMYGKFDKLKRKADSDSVLKVVPSKWSLDNFPMKLTGTKTVYLPSKKIITHDTVVSVEVKKDTVYLTKTVTKNIHTTETVQVEKMVADPRPQAICNAEIKRLQTELSEVNAKATQYKASEQIAKDKLQKRTGVMWWLIVAVVVLLLWTFRKVFGFLR
jgi:hypothetical protein